MRMNVSSYRGGFISNLRAEFGPLTVHREYKHCESLWGFLCLLCKILGGVCVWGGVCMAEKQNLPCKFTLLIYSCFAKTQKNDM